MHGRPSHPAPPLSVPPTQVAPLVVLIYRAPAKTRPRWDNFVRQKRRDGSHDIWKEYFIVGWASLQLASKPNTTTWWDIPRGTSLSLKPNMTDTTYRTLIPF